MDATKEIAETYNDEKCMTCKRIERIVYYISQLRDGAIGDAALYSRTRNYEALARAYEAENICDDILYEINRIIKE